METIKQEFDDVMYFVGFNMKIAGNKLQQWGEQIDQWGKSWGEPEQHIINVNKVVVIEETQGTQVGHKTIFKIMDDNHFEMLPPEGIVNYYVTILKRMETE